MLRQLNQSLRILFKYRLNTSFALVGMSIALCASWFIMDYIKTSYAYDTFHSNHERVYRVSMEVTAGGATDHYATTGKPLGEVMANSITGIEAYAKLKSLPSHVKINGDIFKEPAFYQTNPKALSVFSFDFIRGDQNSLSKPNSILLSEFLAVKYFDQVDLMGKFLQVNGKSYLITGVFKDWPEHSHIKIDALLSLNETTTHDAQSWFDLEQYTYVMTNNSLALKELNQSLDQLVNDRLTPILEGSGLAVRFRAQPLSEVYFSDGLVDDVKHGSLTYLNLLSIVGLLVLLIASLNFVNLTLTRSTQRTKELRLKKIMGISQWQLFTQRCMESGLMTVFIAPLTAIMAIAGEAFYNSHTGYVSLDAANNWPVMLVLLLITFVLGLIGGNLPGLVLSTTKPLGQEAMGVPGFKKVILGLQYGITMIVIAMTMAMGQQLDFIQNKALGFDQDAVLVLELPEDNYHQHQVFKKEISHMAGVKHAALIGGGALPGEENGKDLFEVAVDGTRTEKVYNIYRIDEHYFDLLDIPLEQGRNFQSDRLTDKKNAVIINEVLAKSLNWPNPLGQKISYGGEAREVVGVIKNFHNQSLHHVMEPIVFLYEPELASNLLVKAPASQIETIAATWKDIYPETPFVLTHFDQFITRLYVQEDQLAQLFRFFSFISLLLCAMGLFSLFSLHVHQKTKEISIRKVLGANYLNLFRSLTQRYFIIALLAIGFAIPLSWIFIGKLLNEFSYAITVGIDIYIFSGILVLLTSLLVISHHIMAALRTNPADRLKAE